RRIYEVRHDWVSNYEIRQSLRERSWGVGTLIISTPGHYEGYVEMKCINDPIGLKNMLENVLQKFRRVEELRGKLRRLEEEFEFGRIDAERYNELRNKYLEEIEHIWKTP
ncbi:MAG: PH domain-containing protein, partial [Infirmifilum sp.]